MLNDFIAELERERQPWGAPFWISAIQSFSDARRPRLALRTLNMRCKPLELQQKLAVWLDDFSRQMLCRTDWLLYSRKTGLMELDSHESPRCSWLLAPSHKIRFAEPPQMRWLGDILPGCSASAPGRTWCRCERGGRCGRLCQHRACPLIWFDLVRNGLVLLDFFVVVVVVLVLVLVLVY